MQVYADNAATTRTSRAPIESMIPYFGEFYGNPSSLHDPGQRARDAVEAARAELASALGCATQELYFTSGGTESDNWAITSAAEAGAKKGKKHLIATAIEHHAVLHPLAKLKKQGFEVTLLPVEPNGILDPKTLERALRPDTALVSVMYANNEIGTLQPIREIGAICRAHNVLFHTDAVQAVGHLPVRYQPYTKRKAKLIRKFLK